MASGDHQGNYDTFACDGSDYFHSTTVQCPSCFQRRDTEGRIHVRHTVVSATRVKAGAHRGLPLDVEEGRHLDGHLTQDGELNAAKRLVARVRQDHPQRPLVVLGDALYCHAPRIVPLREERLHHGLGGQAASHPELYTWREDIEKLGGGEHGQWHEGPACRRRFFPYRVARSVPLTASQRVGGTVVEGWEHDRAGQQLYHHAWFTDLEVDADNVAQVIQMGRARWQIENEQFAVHKNHGYELEHNYGHGQQTVSMVFYLRNLLAFIAHMIVERGDRLSQQGVAPTSRRALWHTLRTARRMILVASWAQMLRIYLDEEPLSP